MIVKLILQLWWYDAYKNNIAWLVTYKPQHLNKHSAQSRLDLRTPLNQTFQYSNLFDKDATQKKSAPPTKNFFQVQTRRLVSAASFEPLNSSLPLLALELRMHKAMCDLVVLAGKSPKLARCQSVNQLWIYAEILYIWHVAHLKREIEL